MYIVNGKIYTDAPLLDEIVYNCKLILKDIVVKNEKLALQYETATSMKMAETRYMCQNNTITFLNFPWTYSLFIRYGCTPEEATAYMANLNSVPMEEREGLLELAKFDYVNEFEEQNKYYRSLLGLPEYGTDKFNIYLTPDDFPEDYDTSLIDFSLPIHEYKIDDIEVLQASGRLGELVEQYRSFNYSYLRYLGTNALNLDVCRNSSKWDILYIPPVNANVSSRFQELYNKNKNIYLVKVYQDSYSFGSDYYDNMLIIMLLAQTFNDMIVDVPEWFIRKDVFDIRTVQYFLEAYGIPFFKEIPLKYQIRIVSNINNLIMSKSTIENFDDILNIFSLRETHIYRYYLYKKHKKDDHGQFIIDNEHPENMYELQFIEVLLGDTYDNYIKDISSRIPYDEVTTMDEYWDGGYDHDEIKKQMLQKDFIIEPTKYITIKADIIYGDYQKQLAYFMSMVFDTRISTDDIYITVPSLSESTKFSLSNLMIFIECLCHLYYKTSVDIRRPEDMNERIDGTLPDFKPNTETDDWWMQERYPESFTDLTYNHNRVYGFNPEVDLDALRDFLSSQFTNYSEDNFFYNFTKLYLDSYIPIPSNIYDIESLMDIYENNVKCMDKLQFDILHNMPDKDKQKVANYIYDSIYTKSFNYDLYGGNESLDQVLAGRDYFLYNMYLKLRVRQDTDPESANNDINGILSDIVDILSFYIDRASLDYLFALVSNTSFEAILQYIYLMLDAFKSYKLHFLVPITKYISGTPNIQLGNNMEMNDTIFRHITITEKHDHMHMWDRFQYEEVLRKVEDYFREKLFEILDIYTKVEQDPDDDYEYDGGNASATALDYIKMADGGNAEIDYPFKMLNGYKSYLLKYDEWNLDFNDISLGEDDTVINIDGGNILDSMFATPNIYYENMFKKIYDCGTASTDKFINNNFFLRILDDQNTIVAKVAARTGLIYSEDAQGNIILTEYWREWKNINDFEILNDTSLLAALYAEGKTDLWTQIHDYHEVPWGDEGEDYDYVSNHPSRRVQLYHLDNLMNQNIDISIEDVYPDGNNIVEAEWDFGEVPDDPGTVSGDYNFGEVPDDPGNVSDDYEFGEISDIYYITKLGNYDSSRVITIPRTTT